MFPKSEARSNMNKNGHDPCAHSSCPTKINSGRGKTWSMLAVIVPLLQYKWGGLKQLICSTVVRNLH